MKEDLPPDGDFLQIWWSQPDLKKKTNTNFQLEIIKTELKTFNIVCYPVLSGIRFPLSYSFKEEIFTLSISPET